MSSPNDSNLTDNGPLSELRLRKPPFWLTSLLLIAFVASLVPLAGIAQARFTSSPETRVHIVQDMGTQSRYSVQQTSTVFADGRAARPVIEGTVSKEAVLGDDHYSLGYSKDAAGKVTFFSGFPKRVTVDARLVARGQERFNIYCSTCHGVDGHGNGMINVRAGEVSNGPSEVIYGTAWVQPANLHDADRRARPEGHLFNTISNGIRNMGGLGHQIPTADRWAIVAYVRALQLSDNAPAQILPTDTRENLK